MSESAPRPKAKLPSTVFDWNQLVARPTPAGEIRPVVDAPTATFANFECHVTTLRPREPSHAPHQHADEEVVIVKEGTLEITINGQPHRAPAGSVVFIASNDHHGLRNGGDTTAIYHVLRIVAPAN